MFRQRSRPIRTLSKCAHISATKARLPLQILTEQWEQTRETTSLEVARFASVKERQICPPIPVSLRPLPSQCLPERQSQPAPISFADDNRQRALVAVSSTAATDNFRSQSRSH